MQDSPRIMIIDIAGSGGIAHYTYALAKSLTGFPINIRFVTTKHPELPIQELSCTIDRSFPGHVQRKSAIGKGWAYLLTLGIILFKIIHHRPHIIHIQESKLPCAEWLLLKICRILGTSCVFTLHDIHTRSEMDNRFFQKVVCLSDRIILHSEANKESLMKLLPLNGLPSISIIPHGNYNFLAEPIPMREARNHLNIPINCKIVLFFGYVRHYKGVDVLIEALKLVVQKNSNVKAVIAGKPVGSINPLLKKIQESGLDSKIIIRAEYIPLGEIKYYFSSADIVILPYRSVTQSGMVYLSYAYSKPIIASAVGGLPDLVKHNETGLLIPPENPDALSESMLTLLRDSSLAEKMGKAGYEWMEKDFNWETIARQTKSLYDSIISLRG